MPCMPATCDGRCTTFSRADLDAWVEANRVKPGELTHLAGSPAMSDRYLRGGSSSNNQT